MPDLKTYDLVLSHGWRHNDLNEAPGLTRAAIGANVLKADALYSLEAANG